ncbi:hypothetical protein [Chitinophaga sp. XS-30]|uniref:hypothetical protein n=1 Tax=Chitinophaga sp. XS-30 TaxID=2604421 RepID=UPI0011DE4026|nr:hypothetical protein [Chitinophaga sp. XS-30]QEH42706.1 hypothetical protein FW415_18220 [Chitinophaga sp. XS-30]
MEERTDKYQRSYGYRYDMSNRLQSAQFTQQNSTTSYGSWQSNVMDFSVPHVNYDANGNILKMKQSGHKNNVPAVIDQLRYEYTTNTNQLRFVRDSVNDISTTLGDFKEPPQQQLQQCLPRNGLRLHL